LVEAGIVRAEWQRNASPFVVRIRLEEKQTTILEQLLDEFGYLPRAKEQTNLAEIKRLIHIAQERYGTLGLKTLSQIALGDSKQLTQAMLVGLGIDESAYWVQPDVVTIGASIVRIGGLVRMRGPQIDYYPRWTLPGHCLWNWELHTLTMEQIGKRLYLIENPYPMWELMRRFDQVPVTYACLHGETQFEIGQDSALALFLQKVFTYAPGLETLIWCDPDPAGLQIAQHAYDLVKSLGGSPHFWFMDGNVLDRIEELVIANQRLKLLDDQRRQLLIQMKLDLELEPLRQAILSKGQYSEQEALVCKITNEEALKSLMSK